MEQLAHDTFELLLTFFITSDATGHIVGTCSAIYRTHLRSWQLTLYCWALFLDMQYFQAVQTHEDFVRAQDEEEIRIFDYAYSPYSDTEGWIDSDDEWHVRDESYGVDLSMLWSSRVRRVIDAHAGPY